MHDAVVTFLVLVSIVGGFYLTVLWCGWRPCWWYRHRFQPGMIIGLDTGILTKEMLPGPWRIKAVNHEAVTFCRITDPAFCTTMPWKKLGRWNPFIHPLNDVTP